MNDPHRVRRCVKFIISGGRGRGVCCVSYSVQSQRTEQLELRRCGICVVVGSCGLTAHRGAWCAPEAPRTRDVLPPTFHVYAPLLYPSST